MAEDFAMSVFDGAVDTDTIASVSARNLSREARKMTAIMRQIEEMEQKEIPVKAGPCFTQLEGRVGLDSEDGMGLTSFAATLCVNSA